jgi:dynein heavy chain, axonemal
MSLLARHRYIIARLAESFIRDEIEIEQLMLSPTVLSHLKYFFSADGPTRILILLQQDLQRETSSDPNSQLTSQETLQIYFKDFEKIKTNSVAVYFLKNKKGRDNDDHYAVDPTKANDGAISYGIIRNPLESLEAVVRCVYRPLLQDTSGGGNGGGNSGNEIITNSWGQASEEQRQEFLLGMDSFCKGLQESIRSLSGGLELRRPDDRIESLGNNQASTDPVLVTSCINLLQDWCRNIEHYLEDSDRNRWETPDSGPDTELEYWRSRMQRSGPLSLTLCSPPPSD